MQFGEKIVKIKVAALIKNRRFTEKKDLTHKRKERQIRNHNAGKQPPSKSPERILDGIEHSRFSFSTRNLAFLYAFVSVVSSIPTGGN